MKAILPILTAIFLISSVSALNLQSSTNWFSWENVSVEKGYEGQLMYNGKPLYIDWGTGDNATYQLEISTNSAWFVDYENATISNDGIHHSYKYGEYYHYPIMVKIPKRTKKKSYQVQLCGTACSKLSPSINLCYSSCWTRNIIVTNKRVKARITKQNK